jgi:hypothetical protein
MRATDARPKLASDDCETTEAERTLCLLARTLNIIDDDLR